jgi:soluble lytic murein transglycosylase
MSATRTARRTARPRKASRGRGRPSGGLRSPWPRRLFALLALAAVSLGVYAIATGLFEKAVREITLPLRHEDVIRQESRQHGVDAALIAGVIYTESRFRDQTSAAGARGLMQITPETAEEIEQKSGGTTFEIEDLADPDVNIGYGTFYLRQRLDEYDGNEVAALAAYNAGPGNVATWGGSELELDDIRFAETRSYVEQVLDKREDYRRAYARELGY